MKKIFLTSALCMAFAAPAMADIAANASGATCNTDTLGTGSGNATLEAKWDANTYTCPAGQYLRASDATCQTCPSGSACTGVDDETFADADIGLQSCSAISSDWGYDGVYTQSAAGTSDEGMCYGTTTVNCADVNPYTGGHGTAVYANATATAKIYLNDEDDTFYYFDNPSACAIASLNCTTGYTSNNTNGALSSYIYSNTLWDADHIKYRALNGDSGSNSGTSGLGAHTGLSNGEFEVKFLDNTAVHGMAKCSSTNGTYATVGTPSETDGQYCWCNMTGYNVAGGSLQSVASPSWVFLYDFGSASYCASRCADSCADRVRHTSGFRRALFGLLGANMACEANTISLDWDPKNGQAHTTNQCTYDGAITIPSAPAKTGYTFNGWKLKSGN